ncbi:MAG: hypothetical protein ACYCRH_09745 [Acidiferrobacteraceae bacterium]
MTKIRAAAFSAALLLGTVSAQAADMNNSTPAMNSGTAGMNSGSPAINSGTPSSERGASGMTGGNTDRDRADQHHNRRNGVRSKRQDKKDRKTQGY